MKAEYKDGDEARKNFEETMRELFKGSKGQNSQGKES